MWSLLVLAVVLLGDARADDVTAEQYYQLPRLFHLDDYEACLSQRGAVYCLGSFHLTPTSSQHQLYGVMKEVSTSSYSFDHTKLHRGTCLSSRCAHLLPTKNQTHAFEECTNSWSRQYHQLAASLHQLHYCRTPLDGLVSRPYDTADLVFAGIVGLILFLNILGTAYDVYFKDGKGNRLVLAWSMRYNWLKYTALDQDPNQVELRCTDGIRFVLSILFESAHVYFALFMTYIRNPRHLEQSNESVMGVVALGTTGVPIYVLLSSLMMAHSLLQTRRGRQADPLPLRELPRRVFNRISRTAPLHLFVVGFAATWWPRLSRGPLSALVEQEAAVCHRKWWTHVLFLNNIIQPNSICILSSWFIALDMQLYVVSLVLMLIVVRSSAPIRTLACAVVGCLGLVFCLVYWLAVKEAVFYFHAEFLRGQLADSASFTRFYTAPWGSAAASVMGLALAVLLVKRRNSPSKWMVVLCNLSLPTLLGIVSCGALVARLQHPLAIATVTMFGRPVMALMSCLYIYGLCSDLVWLGAWWSVPCWRLVGRLSLAASLLHWCVVLGTFTSIDIPKEISLISFLRDSAFVWVSTHLLALPVTLLVQYPVQNFLREVI